MSRRRLRAADADRETAFSDLFRALYPQAYRVAYRLLGQAAAAEDAASEAFARTYAHWDEVATLPWRDAWVMKVTANVALNVLARRPAPVRPAAVVESEDAAATRLALVCALSALPRRQQEAIVLHHLAGLTEAEVSAVMGVAPSTVKTHLKRGMEVLRTEFRDDEPDGADVA